MSNWGTVIGPDVSFYQDDNNTPQQIDFEQMKRAGADFVIIRAGQNTWVDPDFNHNWLAAKAAGLPRGAYWFYDSRVSPISQARLFVSLLAGDLPELGAWLDLEESYNGQYKGWASWKLCLEHLRMNLPRVGVYTAPYYWMQNRPNDAAALAFFRSFDLWIAHYNVTTPLIPAPWTSAVLWQYGTPPLGRQYGCESIEIDLNYFNGDLTTFRNYFDLTGTLPPSDGGTTMQYRVVWPDGARKRTAPTTTNSYTALILQVGEVVNAVQDNIPDATYPDNANMRWAKLDDGYFVATDYPSGGMPQDRMVLVEPVPQPANVPDYITAHFTDGTTKKYLPE